ncbi:primosomal protein N' [Symbiobacterium terraclitae]|uniref:primosomal protein N' n=1 Tax=Symbiobacterium terraclitae TaxID=557451 RepID=UPI0035B55806
MRERDGMGAGGPRVEAGAEFAQVAVDVTAEGTDKLFTYLVPRSLAGRLQPGQWVRVPFGHQRMVGLYVGPAERAPEGVALKEIAGLLPEIPPIPAPLVQLARWTADRYLSTFPAALRLLLPPEARRQEVRTLTITSYRLNVDDVEALVEQLGRRAPRQAELLTYMARVGGEAERAQVLADLGESIAGPIKVALEKGWLVAGRVARRRDPFAGEQVIPTPPPVLTPEQQQALDSIRQELIAPPGFRQPVLIHGVTGSGKTELYLRAIAMVREMGRNAICLVPEISLTPQMIQRFRARFGGEVAVLHSALSAGEKFDEWQRIRRGEVSIVVGARSAVFAPFENVGLIIIDEEHEQSYKQESPPPAYHAREVAAERARLEGALLVLGSATPALESFHLARTGVYRLVSLDHRVDDRPMPRVTLVDMREELRAGNRSIFSRALVEALDQTLAAREQAILFLNRRGYNTFILCRTCGEAIQCVSCAVAMTYHLGDDHLACHYCDHTAPVPTVCPKCGSKAIRHLGAGTERVEEELRRLYPGARVARMDVDTTRRKGSHAAILKRFASREVDVLVGTQMITKGLDFPDVTLVGVVLADTSLNLPDFRAAERTFQLVTQVAGRAGRGERPGRVIVQTYQPDHASLLAAAEHDYHRFFAEEVKFREQLDYPPFAHMIHLVLSGEEEAAVIETARAVHQMLVSGGFSGQILGPAPAPLAKLRGRYRHHLVLKGTDIGTMTAEVRAAFAAGRGTWRKSRSVTLSVDVDPMSIL